MLALNRAKWNFSAFTLDNQKELHLMKSSSTAIVDKPPSSRTVDVSEAAAQLGIHPVTAYRLIKRGDFPVRVLRIGRIFRISQSELDSYLAGGQ